MIFRILGPLEVWTDENWTGIGALKWRALLAVLLLNPGQVVSIGRLTEELWGEDPPVESRKLVSGYVYRLRRLMSDAAGEMLVTRAPGYQLLIGPDDVDAGQFESLMAAGRTAFDQGHAEQAAALLSSALDLWRGPALADALPGPVTTAGAGRLDELRLGALELRIEADLACHRLDKCLPELRQMTGEHPLRERFWSQLMRALHASGRSAEALETYVRVQKVLAEELGADPGSDLQLLHQRILAGVPAAGGSAVTDLVSQADLVSEEAAGQRAGPPAAADWLIPEIPRQLPGGVWNFVGRSDALKRLSVLLDEIIQTGTQTGICVITGTAGVGKTTLAVHWGHLAASYFPGGQLYVNLRGFDPQGKPMTPAEAIRGFLDALGVPAGKIPASLDAQAGLYRSLLARRRMLIVLDNAHDADQVRPLLPGAAGSLVLVMSRYQLASLIATEDARAIVLGVLTAAQARDLLERRLGAERTAADPGSLAELAGFCAHLPLALSIAAARAEVRPGLPLAAVTAELRDSRGRLNMLEAGDAATSVRTVFSWSYQQLTEQSARMFRLIGSLPGPDLPVSAAASLANLPVSEARAALAELTSAGLMIEDPPGRFFCHDLLQAYAAEQCEVYETEAGRKAAMRRLLDHYLHSAHAAARLLYPQHSLLSLVTVIPPVPGVVPEEFTSYAEALSWFEAERKLLVALVIRAMADKFDTHAMQIPLALRAFLHRRGFWQECATVVEVALAAARRLNDSAGQAHSHRLLGSTYIYLNSSAEAAGHLYEAVNLYQIISYPIGQADAYIELAHIFDREHRPADSLRYSEMALEQYRNAGFQTGEARALANIGWSYVLMEDFEHASSYLEQAVDLQHQAGDWHSLASTLDSLGYARYRLSQYTLAIDYYERADALSYEIGDLNQRAILLSHLGDAYRAAGNAQGARRVWEQALGLLHDLGRPEDHEIHEKLADLGPQDHAGCLAGLTVPEVLADFPYLDRDDVLAALEFAAAAVQERELPLAQPASSVPTTN